MCQISRLGSHGPGKTHCKGGPPFTRISRIPGAGQTQQIGLSGSGGRGGRSGEPRPQGRWAGFGSRPSRTRLFGFGVAGMSSAMQSRKLTAEDRRTPISRPFLVMAFFVYDNRFCLGPLFLSTSIRWFFVYGLFVAVFLSTSIRPFLFIAGRCGVQCYRRLLQRSGRLSRRKVGDHSASSGKFV